MNQFQDKNFRSTFIGTIIIAVIGFAAFYFGLIGYGMTLFILIPVYIGFFGSKLPTWSSSSLIAATLGFIAFLFLLLTAQLEGVFCVITLLPLVIVCIFAGAIFGWSLRKLLNRRRDKKNEQLKFSVYPLLILLFGAVTEHFFSSGHAEGRVESNIVLAHRRTKVFEAIKNVDTLQGTKPFLLLLGLPVPLKCVLEGDSIGAARTCYFKEGTIDEKVTAFEPGEKLQMEVTRYGLPGRHWLTFRDATYHFSTINDSTRLTRITTYRSALKPRWYWRYWEEKAIAAEHDYVLRDLSRRLSLQ